MADIWQDIYEGEDLTQFEGLCKQPESMKGRDFWRYVLIEDVVNQTQKEEDDMKLYEFVICGKNDDSVIESVVCDGFTIAKDENCARVKVVLDNADDIAESGYDSDTVEVYVRPFA